MESLRVREYQSGIGVLNARIKAAQKINAEALAAEAAKAKEYEDRVRGYTSQQARWNTSGTSNPAKTVGHAKALAEHSWELHSAMRGIAGATGQLFLTYGDMLPLVSSFLAAMSVKTAITEYKDLEYQLKFVQAVAQDTTVSIGTMMDALGKASVNAGVAPVEAAKGLRYLAQAGLDTTSALEALPAVMDVARVGELSMENATTTLTGAVNAFGLRMKDIGYVGDVFVKAGAISNTSVAQISESMKTASTVAQQYRLSVEDVGTALVALAKRNITGTSAGTAFTQLMTELATPKGEAIKAARFLKISLYDPMTSDTKDFFGKFIPELREKLKVFNPQDRTFILNKMANERGSKALQAILGMTDAELAIFKTELEAAGGMAKEASRQMLDSVQGDYDKLKATLRDSLGKAGGAGVDSLRDSLQRLREVVASEDFVNSVAMLVKGFTTLVSVATSVGTTLFGPVGAIAAAGVLATTLPGVNLALRTLMVTMGFVGSTAAGAAVAATGLYAALLRIATASGVGIVIAGAAYALTKFYDLLSKNDPVDNAMSAMDRLIKKEEDYQKSLSGSVQLLEKKNNLAYDGDLGVAMSGLDEAKRKVETAKEKLALVSKNSGGPSDKSLAQSAQSPAERLAAAELMKAQTEFAEADLKYQTLISRQEESANMRARKQAADAKEREELLKTFKAPKGTTIDQALFGHDNVEKAGIAGMMARERVIEQAMKSRTEMVKAELEKNKALEYLVLDAVQTRYMSDTSARKQAIAEINSLKVAGYLGEGDALGRVAILEAAEQAATLSAISEKARIKEEFFKDEKSRLQEQRDLNEKDIREQIALEEKAVSLARKAVGTKLNGMGENSSSDLAKHLGKIDELKEKLRGLESADREIEKVEASIGKLRSDTNKETLEAAQKIADSYRQQRHEAESLLFAQTKEIANVGKASELIAIEAALVKSLAAAKLQATVDAQSANGEVDSILKQSAESANSVADAYARIAQGVSDLDIAKLKEEVAVIGLSAQQVNARAIATLSVAKAQAEAKLSMLDENDIRTAEAYRKQIEGIDYAIDKLKTKGDLLDQRQLRQDFADLGKDLENALMNGGKGAGEALKNYFKKMVVHMLVSPIMQAGMNSLGATLGMPGANGSAGLSSLGSLGGVGQAYTWASGAMGSALSGTALGGFGQAAAATGSNGLVAGFGTNMANIGTLAEGGMWLEAIGAASPYIAAALAAYALFSEDTKPSIEGGYSTAGNPGTNGKSYVNGYYGGKTDSTSRAIVDSVTNDYYNTVKSYGGKAGAFTASQFTGVDQNGHDSAVDMTAYINGKAVYSRGSEYGGNIINVKSDEVQAAIDLSSKKALVEALKATDMGPTLNEYLKGVTTTGKDLTAITNTLKDINSIGVFTNTLKRLPDYFKELSNASAPAILKLAEVSGGIANFQSAVSNYYDKFATDGEKTADLLKFTQGKFSELGKTMPGVNNGLRDWYTSEVKRMGAMDLSVEANATAYKSMLDLADSVDALTNSEKKLSDTNKDWQDQLDVMSGRTTDRAIQLAKVTDESTRALMKQVWAQQDLKAVADKVTQANIDNLKALTDFGKSVRDFLKGLATGDVGTSPESRLAATRAKYLEDLSGSRAGNADAYASLTDSASSYLKEATAYYASGPGAQAILAQIKSEMGSLDPVTKLDANLQALKDIEKAVRDSTGTLSSSLQTMTEGMLASFTKLDTTADGLLDFNELKEGLGLSDEVTRQLIAAVDLNGDKQVSKLELLIAANAGLRTDLLSNFNNFDLSKNGLLGFDELKTALNIGDELTRQLIAAVDTNGDGQISKLEVIAANTFGMDKFARIVSEVNKYNWNDKAGSAAAVATTAKANGWTLSDIASALGYNLSDIVTLFAGTGVSVGVGAASQASSYSGMDKAAAIVKATNSFDWSAANKSTTVASMTILARSMGWTLADIASALGYNLSDIQALFLGSGLAVGGSTSTSGGTSAVSGGGGSGTISSGPSGGGSSYLASSSGTTATEASGIVASVNNLDWNDKASAATSLWNTSYWNNWTQQDIANALGYNLTDIQALFRDAGLPAFAGGGYHTGGARIVGEYGPELAVTGPEYIFNARDTQSLLRSGGASDDEVAAEMAEMRRQLSDLMSKLITVTAAAANANLARQDRLVSAAEENAKFAALDRSRT